MEAWLKVLKVAPGVLKLEVRRLEVEVRHRIDHFRHLVDRDPEEARKVVEALLDGPATFTPIETPDGRRYKVEGWIATGACSRCYPVRNVSVARANLTLRTVCECPSCCGLKRHRSS